MDSSSRDTLQIIVECIAEDRIRILKHFLTRMQQRGYFWPDVQHAIENAEQAESAGEDRFGRPKWVIVGPSSGNETIGIVCTFDVDDEGEITVFITLFENG